MNLGFNSERTLLKQKCAAIVLSLLLTGSFTPGKAEADTEAQSILAACKSELQPVLDQQAHAVTVHQQQMVYGAQISQIVRSTSDRLSKLGPSIATELITAINNTDLRHYDEAYSAIACSNALASFGKAALKPTVQALGKTSDGKKQFFLNALLIEFPDTVNYVAGALPTAQGHDKAFLGDLLSQLLRQAYPQFWENGVPSLVENVRAQDKNAPVEPLLFAIDPIFRAQSPAAQMVPADLMRLPAQMEPYLLARLHDSKDKEDRMATIRALSFLYPPDERAIAPLESILHTKLAFDDHPYAADALGRIVFRLGSKCWLPNGQKKPGCASLSDQQVADAEAALREALDGHFSKMPAWYALCELGACYPDKSKALVEAIERPTNVAPSPRRLAYQLMKNNGWPSADIVLPALVRVTQLPPPRETDVAAIEANRAKQDAASVLNKAKATYSNELKKYAVTQAPAPPRPASAATAKPGDKLSAVRDKLKTQDAMAFNQALADFRDLGPAGAALIPDVVAAYEARGLGDSSEARTVEISLEQLGPAAVAAVPWLEKQLNSGYGAVSWGAVETLGAIGPGASSSEKSLRKFVTKNPSAMQIVNRSLAQMKLVQITEKDLEAFAWKPEKALEYLDHAPSGDYVQRTLAYLQEQGPKAAYAVPKLIEYGSRMKVNDKYWSSRMEVASVFEAIGPAASPAVPLLTEWLKDKYVNLSASQALNAIQKH